MTIDWQAFMYAGLLGLPLALVFFIGLKLGLNKALASDNPALWLFGSFALRSVLVLAGALLLIKYLEPLSALLGLMAAFMLIRLLSVRFIRQQEG